MALVRLRQLQEVPGCVEIHHWCKPLLQRHRGVLGVENRQARLLGLRQATAEAWSGWCEIETVREH